MPSSRRTPATAAPAPVRPARNRTRAAAPRRAPSFKTTLTLETPLGAVLSDSRIRLLEAIDRVGSLNRAAGEVPLSYKAAWDALAAMNALAPEPLVERSTGGVGGGGTRLTDYARRLIALYRAMESSQQDILDRIGPLPAEDDAATLRSLIRRIGFQTSARNQLHGQVVGLIDRGGLVDVQLRLDTAPDSPGAAPLLVATITPESVGAMGLGLGVEVHALVKAPAVQLLGAAPRRAVGPGRNLLAGTLAALRPGPAHVGASLALPGGATLAAVVDPDTAQALAVGQPAWAAFDGDQVVLVRFG